MKFLVLLALVVGISACSGSSKNVADAEPMHEAPNEAPVAPPSGPPVLENSVGTQKSQDVPPVEPGDASQAPNVARSDVSKFMDHGPAFLLTQIEVKPVHGKEGFEGYRLVSTRGGVRSFMEPQIQLGDVVTHVNGIRLERPDDYLQAWNSLAKTEWIRVDFKRDAEKKHALWAVGK